ncbi:hypothetical protein [Albimonas pacifica]|uniref:Uncharacterized protein n=1 Tax=Albimonas pacifica TaxID=1114924 RepID=A0A1I3DTD9_9RHOB|nr:hypothetical protein [Albimonas pacifica]SFH89994.1 hypothetical protein SAMN05216258_1032 [Albimonas pacifica]
MSRNEQYRKVKAIVRQLGCRDSLYAIWAYSQWLQVDDFQFPGDIQVHRSLIDAQLPQAILSEFALEQIAREAILHADILPRRGRTLRQWDTLADIVNGLRALEGEIYSEFQIGKQIHLELMRIAHRQFVWQQFRFQPAPVIRYYKLYNTPLLEGYTQAATGLTLKELYTIGMLYTGHFLDAPRISRTLNIQIPGLTQDHFERFLAFTSLRRNDLAGRLRAEHALDQGFGYRYSSLREFPMVGMSHRGQDELACPIPMLLYWRFMTGLYYTLKDIEGFFTEFGSSFQRYVGEVLNARVTSAERAVLAEEKYLVGKNQKHTVDWIVQQGEEAALFIECKTKRMTWASKAEIADLSALQKDLDTLAAAVVQVYKTIVDYRAGSYPQLPFMEGRQVFPMVVTLEDWYLFGSEMPARLNALVRTRMSEANLSEAWLHEMPYAILSVDELERAARYFSDVDLPALVLGRARSNDYSRWGFASYCSEVHGKNRPVLPPLFEEEFDALFSKLAT